MHMNESRRLILKAFATSGLISTGVFSCALLPSSISADNSTSNRYQGDWAEAKKIRDAIIRPIFASNTFNILDFGAKGDNKTDCTQAFAKAIQACNQQGGGKVIVPAGSYLTGPIHLLSNVNLHIEEHAIIRFIPEPKRYLPLVKTRWEGLELMGYSPLIYAYKQKNIAVTGKGTLDGGATDQIWWPWKGPHKEKHWDLIPGEDQKPARMQLMADAENHVPVEERIYGEGAYLRPPFVQPYECENVLLEDFTIKNSPFWLLNPVLCQHVTVKGVTLDSHGPNNDGCDPESCDHVLIEDCTFNTGDDCIAIKSGRNADGRRINVPTQNVVIANCNMIAGHGGVVIGSEISGGVNHVFVENCQMSSPELERAIRIKTNSVRGGLIEHLRYRDINVGVVQNAIVINYFYEEGDAGNFDPIVRNIKIENLVCQKVLKKPMNIQGFSRDPIYDVHLTNCHFNQAKEKSIVRDINNLTFTNVSINGKAASVDDVVSTN